MSHPPTTDDFEKVQRAVVAVRAGLYSKHEAALLTAAMEAVLAYARLGVETIERLRRWQSRGDDLDTDDLLLGSSALTSKATDLGLLAPAAQEEKRDG